MRKTLYLKFLLAYLIFGFFGFIVVATFGSSMTLEHMKREKADTLYKEATLIANTYASDLYNNEASLETVKIQLDSLAVYLDSTIWIINPSGRMIMDTNTPVDLDHPRIVEGFNATETVGSYYTIGNFFDSFDKEMLSVYAPITSDFKVRGYVVIHTAMASLRSTSESLLSISYIILVILFLLSLIILIFFTEMVYLPLRKITEATEQYAAGNLHYEFQVDSEDEIGYLAASLSYMASEIARGEDNQKKFIANVSHDIKTPLTSIISYVELLKEEEELPDHVKDYISILESKSQRLKTMVQDVFEVSKAASGELPVNPETIDFAKLLRQTLADMEEDIKNSNVIVRTRIPEGEHFIRADGQRMYRVFQNLIQNALQYSLEGSRVYVSLEEKNGLLTASVTNTSAEELSETIDYTARFTRGDSSRTDGGSGLGLSIARSFTEACQGNFYIEIKADLFTACVEFKETDEEEKEIL